MKLKTVLFTSLLALSLSTSVFAQTKRKHTVSKSMDSEAPAPHHSSGGMKTSYGVAGCGLGSMIIGDQPGYIQILAATLNGTGVQTFGITTGTSNCDAHNNSNASLVNFIDANTIALEKDASRGNGQSIQGLAQVMGCTDTAKLGNALQSNYSEIFADKKSSQETAQRVIQAVKGSAELNKNCAFHG